MGGNVQVNGYKAEKIPVKEIGLNKFQKDFKKLLKDINRLYHQKNKKYIWNDESIIDSAYAFNGSTSFLMDPNYLKKEKELMLLKPTSGDIDIMVPDSIKDNFIAFIDILENKKIDNFEYIGKYISPLGDQINSLFRYCYKKDKCILAQIDFEFLPFDGNIPNEFAKFSHSSSFKDLKAGVKGAFHKLLLRSISHIASKLENVVFATKTSSCEKLRISKAKKKDAHYLKFSVAKGLRVAYEPMICNNIQVKVDGKPVYKEVSTDKSIYETDLGAIFKALFGEEPNSKDKDDFWSFVGLLDLIKKYFTKKQIEEIFIDFQKLLWENKSGRNIGQELERDNPDLDYSIKKAAIDKFIEKFPYLEKLIDENMIDNYYKNYGQRGSAFKEAYFEILNLIRISDDT